ncbi:MAG: transposase [Verrucomicrobia bacterium]|nr:transposase [Verrucomicrobiota bacterium]
MRIEYPGAFYHVMCRGDRGEAVFRDDGDRLTFLKTLSETCSRTGWRVHAYVLMSNHYHLLIETPEANLVAGMKWMQGTYTQRFNTRHRVRGHLFQGRYRAIPVQSDEPEYLRLVSAYIHANPVRAGLLKEAKEFFGYRWSSLPAFTGQARLADWLVRRQVFEACGIVREGRKSRQAYRSLMVERMRDILNEQGRKESEATWNDLRRGWCVGGAEFRDWLLDRVGERLKGRRRESYRGENLFRHDDRTAESLLLAGLKALGLALGAVQAMKKSAPEKQALLWLVKTKTVVGDEWVVARLNGGHRSNVSRAVRAFSPPADRKRKVLARKLHICTD